MIAANAEVEICAHSFIIYAHEIISTVLSTHPLSGQVPHPVAARPAGACGRPPSPPFSPEEPRLGGWQHRYRRVFMARPGWPGCHDARRSRATTRTIFIKTLGNNLELHRSSNFGVGDFRTELPRSLSAVQLRVFERGVEFRFVRVSFLSLKLSHEFPNR